MLTTIGMIKRIANFLITPVMLKAIFNSLKIIHKFSERNASFFHVTIQPLTQLLLNCSQKSNHGSGEIKV
jgi:hypothetical protein